MKQYYTTGDIAEICSCTPRTVSKWIDSGQMKGIRLPLSNDRRVHKDDLDLFLSRYGFKPHVEPERDETGASLEEFELALEGRGPLVLLWHDDPGRFVKRLIERCKSHERATDR